jgi:hypothetical protein
MTKIDFPPSPRHVVLLSLILFAPLALSFAGVWFAAPKPGQVPPVLGVLLLVFAAIIVLVARRHSIEISPQRLTVRHSAYTARIERSEVAALSVQEVATAGQLGLVTRTNGIAAFGYLSGWFRRTGNGSTFCAVSHGPLYLVTFEGSAKCKHLALSASPDVARRIAAWAA